MRYMDWLDDAIYIVLVCAVTVTAGKWTLDFIDAAAPPLVAPAVLKPISCAGRADCHVQVFSVDNDRKAYCAFWDNGQAWECDYE